MNFYTTVIAIAVLVGVVATRDNLTEMIVFVVFFGIVGGIVYAVIRSILKRMPGKRRSNKASSNRFYTKAVGVTFENDDGSSRQEILSKYCKDGAGVQLVFGINDATGKMSAAVMIDGMQIGHLRENIAVELNNWKKNGGSVSAKIAQCTGGGGKNRGANLIIEKY